MNTNHRQVEKWRHLEDNPVNFQVIDSSIKILQSGDLVLRTGNDAISYMLRQMNQHNKTYSHCGIVMIENGYPFVYHSIGGEDNPDETLRRDSASFFFSPVHNLRFAIVRLDMNNTQVMRLHSIVQRWHDEKIKFDMDFDLADDKKFYCAEFVYRSLQEATSDSAYIIPSIVLKKVFVGVDDLYENKHVQWVRERIYQL